MIQFNLLPDVKMAFIKAERTKRLVIAISLLASAVAIALLLLLVFTVDVIQKKSLSDKRHDIASYSKQLKATPDLDKILTIQNQLSALTSLHDQKPAAARLFQYLTAVTPAKATIGNAAVDFTANTMTIEGNADSISTINTFADTLKFTKYSTDADPTPKNAFSQVVLANFAAGDATGKGPTYSITLATDPAIFDNTLKPTLTVPQTVTTRSIANQPTDLFQQQQTSTR